MVIGKLGTTFQVGIFSRGMGFIQFITATLMKGISPVVLPYLSGARREGSDVRFAYQRASVLLGALVCPVLAVGSLATLPAIRLFFGSQWDAAAPLAAWLALWAAFRVVHFFSDDVMVAMHKEKIMVGQNLFVFSILSIGIITAFPAGLERVAQTFTAVGVVDAILSTWVLKACIGLKIIPFIRAWVPNLLITVSCALMTLAIRQFLDFELAPAWQPILALALIMPPFWLLMLFGLGHPLFLEFQRALNSVFRKK
jgi:O-antigen/teichoic acid export membrane protein